MKARNNTKTETSTLKLKARLTLKFGIIVAAVVGCLLNAPLTSDHKHVICEQHACTVPLKAALGTFSGVR